MRKAGFRMSDYPDVAAEIENRVRIARREEMLGHEVGEVSFPYRTEVELHSFRENHFPSFDPDVFEIRTRSGNEFFGNETPGLEIMGISEKRDVEKRVEISARTLETILGNPQESKEFRRNLRTAEAVENGKGGIGYESGKFLLEVGNAFERRLDERVKAPVVFTEKRDDEQGPEGAESVIEFAVQRTILRS